MTPAIAAAVERRRATVDASSMNAVLADQSDQNDAAAAEVESIQQEAPRVVQPAPELQDPYGQCVPLTPIDGETRDDYRNRMIHNPNNAGPRQGEDAQAFAQRMDDAVNASNEAMQQPGTAFGSAEAHVEAIWNAQFRIWPRDSERIRTAPLQDGEGRQQPNRATIENGRILCSGEPGWQCHSCLHV